LQQERTFQQAQPATTHELLAISQGFGKP
jgi:hypothetical protein